MRNILFTLNPAQAITSIIDFTKDSNVKLYRKATSKLSEDLFDCVSEDLLQFLNNLSDRATELSWNDPIVGIIMITEDPTKVSTVYKNLITNHGEITLGRHTWAPSDQWVCTDQSQRSGMGVQTN